MVPLGSVTARKLCMPKLAIKTTHTVKAQTFIPLNVFLGWDFPGSPSHWGGVSDLYLDDFASDLTQHVPLVVVSHVVVQEVLGEDDPQSTDGDSLQGCGSHELFFPVCVHH